MTVNSLHRVKDLLSQLPEGQNAYYQGHLLRYAHTLDEISNVPCRGGTALEVGYTDLFQFLLSADLGVRTVLGTEFRNSNDVMEVRSHAVSVGGQRVESTIYRLNIEHEMLPITSESVDFILCSEVIEHMDVDPMYPLAEFNRLLKRGGSIVITTPNSTSYAMVAKVLTGYRPHFYMQYHRDRNRYRHNFEHDSHSLLALTKAAGFEADEIKSLDVFEPPHQVGMELCAKLKLSDSFRGDCLFFRGRKVNGVVDRFPYGVYV